MTAPDLYDVSRCPQGHRCESCGIESDDLQVHAVTLTLAVICLTLCPICATFDGPPPISPGTTTRLIEQHAGHVGGWASAPPKAY